MNSRRVNERGRQVSRHQLACVSGRVRRLVFSRASCEPEPATSPPPKSALKNLFQMPFLFKTIKYRIQCLKTPYLTSSSFREHLIPLILPYTNLSDIISFTSQTDVSEAEESVHLKEVSSKPSWPEYPKMLYNQGN